MAGKRKCCLKGCAEPARARGLCNTDYHAANALVNRGETTWAKLEAKKLARPPRSAKSRFARALETSH